MSEPVNISDAKPERTQYTVQAPDDALLYFGKDKREAEHVTARWLSRHPGDEVRFSVAEEHTFTVTSQTAVQA